MQWLVPAAVFLIGAGAVLGIVAAVTYLPGAMLRRRVQRRMGIADDRGRRGPLLGTIVKDGDAGLLPSVDRLMVRTAAGLRLTRSIEQAGLTIMPSSVVLAVLGLAAVCAVLGSMAARAAWAPFAGGALGGALPFVWLRTRRRRRIRRFEEQFPEALELLSRALRAGHAFTTAMSMAADELPNPVGKECRRTFDQQNFGLPLKDALNAMSERVPLLDVRFFVTAVLIQRETGGNLSEILDNLAHVVRERFKVLRQVRVHTAHGRFTGYVLMALPAALVAALSVINPDHVATLFYERLGQMMVAAAISLQAIGYVWIRHVVKIEV